MSDDVLVEVALQRQEAFKNLPKYLEIIKKIAHRIDPKAKIYLFGSATTEEHNFSSDIDILIITKAAPAKVLSELARAGITDPFEIHVHTSKEADLFKKTTRLIRA